MEPYSPTKKLLEKESAHSLTTVKWKIPFYVFPFHWDHLTTQLSWEVLELHHMVAVSSHYPDFHWHVQVINCASKSFVFCSSFVQCFVYQITIPETFECDSSHCNGIYCQAALGNVLFLSSQAHLVATEACPVFNFCDTLEGWDVPRKYHLLSEINDPSAVRQSGIHSCWCSAIITSEKVAEIDLGGKHQSCDSDSCRCKYCTWKCSTFYFVSQISAFFRKNIIYIMTGSVHVEKHRLLSV